MLLFRSEEEAAEWCERQQRPLGALVSLARLQELGARWYGDRLAVRLATAQSRRVPGHPRPGRPHWNLLAVVLSMPSWLVTASDRRPGWSRLLIAARAEASDDPAQAPGLSGWPLGRAFPGDANGELPPLDVGVNNGVHVTKRAKWPHFPPNASSGRISPPYLRDFGTHSAVGRRAAAHVPWDRWRLLRRPSMSPD